MGTHLLASLGSKGKNGNSLACLRNAGSHSAMTYCTHKRTYSPSPLRALVSSEYSNKHHQHQGPVSRVSPRALVSSEYSNKHHHHLQVTATVGAQGPGRKNLGYLLWIFFCMAVCSTTTARTGSFKVRHQLTLGRRPAADGQARSDRSTCTHDGTCTEPSLH